MTVNTTMECSASVGTEEEAKNGRRGSTAGMSHGGWCSNVAALDKLYPIVGRNREETLAMVRKKNAGNFMAEEFL